MRLKFFIDTHKGATGIVMLLLMALYDSWDNPTAWVYLALHGSYGLLWVLKSRIFPDARWEQRVSWRYGILGAWGGLTLYWVGGWMVNALDIRAPDAWLALCIALYASGVFWHFGADMQKHMALKLNPGHLISDGFWRYSRNPNYFGELLIYLGFGLLALSPVPVLILLLWIAAYWLPSMRRKDASLARYPEFADYARRTRRFVPFVPF